VSVTERWARTQSQIDLMQRARHEGGQCTWCGRELGDDEPVYFDLFLVGEKRPGTSRSRPYRSRSFAPVCARCASPDLFARTADLQPEPCGQCGRGIYWPNARTSRKAPACSRICDHRLGRTRALLAAGGAVVDNRP
jgi:hypothetical protein